MADVQFGVLGDGLVFGLRLDHLHPDREPDRDLTSRDMVAQLSALEDHHGTRVALQITCRPDVKRPEFGLLDVHVFGAVDTSVGDAEHRLADLAEDLQDLLAAPPLRWSFSPVTALDALERALAPMPATFTAEIARREEPCRPTGWRNDVGYRGSPGQAEVMRSLWSTWTLGPATPDLRRLASVLLLQSAPICLRVVLSPTELHGSERSALEELVRSVGTADLPTDGLLRASLHTLESLMFVRPLFEAQCIVSSPDRLSRSLLSAIGHSMSEPAPHGYAGPVLQGGYAIHRPVDADETGRLRDAHDQLRPTGVAPTLAPVPLARLRRLVGAWEAANLFRLPIADDETFPGLTTHDLPALRPPLAAMPRSGTRIGHLVGHSDQPVLIADEDRSRHLYVSGQTGTGKSTLLMNLALQDIERGAGVAVIDPHGDLVDAILARIPTDRLDDVVLVDPSDDTAVVGVNLLEAETPTQAAYIVSELAEMFYALFDRHRQGIIGPRFETMLRQAALLLMQSEGVEASMLDISTVITDRAVQKHLVAGLNDPILAEYWHGEVAQTADYHRSELLGWFRSKFEVFRTSPMVRRVVGQARSTVSFADILRNDQILLVNLSKGTLGSYNSALIGQIVFARLWAATLERASMPMSERNPFYVYVDEFQNMTTDSLPSILSEARKFRVGLTLANQFFTQIPELTRDAIMGNVASSITFRLGPKDAALFAQWLGGGLSADDLTGLPNFHAIAGLGHKGVPLDPVVMRSDGPLSEPDEHVGTIARDRSRTQWALPVEAIDDDFRGRWSHINGSFAQASARADAKTKMRPPPTGSDFLDEWFEKREPTIEQDHDDTIEIPIVDVTPDEPAT